MALWGGRFEAESDPLFKTFNDSLPFDHRLVDDDVAGSRAWATALEEAGVLSADERSRIAGALDEIAAVAARTPAAITGSGEEDIHTWVETQLIERVGPLGKKLHTGRSRNDQVATDLRLWTRREVAMRQEEIRDVQRALLSLADRQADAVLPGFTHLQRAQPILFGHWCLAYHEMLGRDDTRFRDAAQRAGECPLGCGALAGTAYPIDRDALARTLGFDGPARNSLDAVSDRDFVFETLGAAALCGVHLSRLAEDLIFYASSEAGFVELDDSMTSGSSMMPQKKNPDALELVRGKTGRLLGALVSICVTLKGLPLAYNKDLQEDKEPLFDAMASLSIMLRVIPPILDQLVVCVERTRQAAAGGHTNATDLADYLVDRQVPFREAHEQVGRVVQSAIARNEGLETLPLQTLREHAPAVGEDVRVHLTVDASLARRDALGGTSPRQVAAALRAARHRLGPHVETAADRPLRIRTATIDDVDGICRLVDHWAREGENLPRTRASIVDAVQDFAVAVDGAEVVACGSLVIYTETLAEIRSLGVDPGQVGGGIGRRIVGHFIERAAQLHLAKVFVLTRTPGFFERCGFRQSPIEVLPHKVWRDCVNCPKQNRCDEIPMVCEVA